MRTVLRRAARVYRDNNGRPWLTLLPPLITMLPESPRAPYPITWDEQDRLFPTLPAHLGLMVLFAVNTGLRDNKGSYRSRSKQRRVCHSTGGIQD